MLIRRSAGLLATALLIGLTPPLTGDSRADADGWGMRFARDLVQAQRVTRGKGVKIALLGDGVAPGVRPLRGALGKEKDFVRTPRPKRMLGTLMASLIAGGGPTADNPSGIRGLASGATILPVRVYAGPQDPGNRRWLGGNGIVAEGIRHAVDQGADVIAVEAYGNDTLNAAVAYALRKNVVVVAPSGLQDPFRPSYPGATPGVIGVGALTDKGRRDKRYTTNTSAVLVSAPAVRMPSTGPDNRLWTFWGNPVALVFVTSVVAMVKSEYPKLTPAQVGQALAASARHPKGKGRYDTDLGFGYLNAAGALDEARGLTAKPAPAMTAESSVQGKARLGGDRPGTIRAVPYDPLWLGGFGALAYAGLVALGFAAWLALRKRPVTPAAATAVAGPGPGPSESADAFGS